MQTHDFLGQVQARARLSSPDEAARVTRATLETLGERLEGGEPDNLAAQLPGALKHLLSGIEGRAERFGLDEFVERVSARSGAEITQRTHPVRAVFAVLDEAVAPGTLAHMREQLPGDYQPLFEAGGAARCCVAGRA